MATPPQLTPEQRTAALAKAAEARALEAALDADAPRPSPEFDAAFAARQATLPRARTDAGGFTRIALNWPEVEAEGVLLNAAVTVRVSDGAGRPVERTLTRPVAPAGPVIGIRPGFDDVLPELKQTKDAILIAVVDAHGQLHVNPREHVFSAGDEVIAISRGQLDL